MLFVSRFFTSHSQSKSRNFSPTNFTRNLVAVGFHRMNACERWEILSGYGVYEVWIDWGLSLKASAQVMAKPLLINTIPTFRTPEHIKSDRGSHFISTVIQELCVCLQIDLNQGKSEIMEYGAPSTTPKTRRQMSCATGVEVTTGSHSAVLCKQNVQCAFIPHGRKALDQET